MSVIDTILAAQGGQILTVLAAAAGCSGDAVRQSLEQLAPLIARAIADKADDEHEFEVLLDVLDDTGQDYYLDDPRIMLSRGAVRDGEEILEHVFGSLEEAHRQASSLPRPDEIDRDLFERLMTFAATLTVAAMARRNRAMMTAAAVEDGGGGIMAMLVASLVKGLSDGLMRALRPRRRRRRTYSRRYSRSRRRRRRGRTRRRRQKTPSLGDLIGDLINNRGN